MGKTRCNTSQEFLCIPQAQNFKVCLKCGYLLAGSGTHSHTLAWEHVFHQNYKLQYIMTLWGWKEQKLNHYIQIVHWPGLICILGAKPNPTLMGHALLPKSLHLSGPNLPYLRFGSFLDWPEDHYFARQWIPLLVSSFQSQKVLL